MKPAGHSVSKSKINQFRELPLLRFVVIDWNFSRRFYFCYQRWEEFSHESSIIFFMSRDSPVLQLTLLNSLSQQLMYHFLQRWMHYPRNSRMLTVIGCLEPSCVAGSFIRKHLLFLRGLVEQPSGWKSFILFWQSQRNKLWLDIHLRILLSSTFYVNKWGFFITESQGVKYPSWSVGNICAASNHLSCKFPFLLVQKVLYLLSECPKQFRMKNNCCGSDHAVTYAMNLIYFFLKSICSHKVDF